MSSPCVTSSLFSFYHPAVPVTRLFAMNEDEFVTLLTV